MDVTVVFVYSEERSEDSVASMLAEWKKTVDQWNFFDTRHETEVNPDINDGEDSDELVHYIVEFEAIIGYEDIDEDRGLPSNWKVFRKPTDGDDLELNLPTDSLRDQWTSCYTNEPDPKPAYKWLHQMLCDWLQDELRIHHAHVLIDHVQRTWQDIPYLVDERLADKSKNEDADTTSSTADWKALKEIARQLEENLAELKERRLEPSPEEEKKEYVHLRDVVNHAVDISLRKAELRGKQIDVDKAFLSHDEIDREFRVFGNDALVELFLFRWYSLLIEKLAHQNFVTERQKDPVSLPTGGKSIWRMDMHIGHTLDWMPIRLFIPSRASSASIRTK